MKTIEKPTFIKRGNYRKNPSKHLVRRITHKNMVLTAQKFHVRGRGPFDPGR